LAYISLIALGAGDLFAFYVFFPFVYIPKVLKAVMGKLPELLGAMIPQLIAGVFQQQTTSEKMKGLAQKGVEARQQKAEEGALLALVSTEDPLKGIIADLVPSLLSSIPGAEGLPAYARKGIESRVRTGIINSPVNLTNAVAPPVIKWLDEKVTQFSGGKVHLAEELKALGVLSNAEKVA
jgi:hypothetical protein